ncbi:MAG: TonB-dependent receptor [Ferruginibacter sp.]|nr:TonB-dependent receptor [Ferruginibacter sp.]
MRFKSSRSYLLLLLLMQPFGYLLAQDQHRVTGKVADSKGVSAAGVTVTVKGTKNITVTDTDGSFSTTAKAGDVLVLSSVSFVKKEIPVTSEVFYTIELTEATIAMTDVVVVGYGKQNRKNLTSSVTTIKAEDLNRGAISDPAQLLQGKVAGLNITRSGDPNRGAAIVLRGASTLRDGAQSPFFVIDGIPGADISIVAPDDIVSMDVLKDAAATAIYGNRAANGVIMVTTRRARKGQLQLGYNGYVALEKVSNKFDMMDATQLRDFLKKNNQTLTPANDLGANTNWQSAVQREQAISHNHNISLGGGTDKTLYSASLNYFDQEGIMKTSALNRIIARLSIEQKAFDDKLKIGLSVSNSVSNADYLPYRNTVLAQMLTYLPTVPVKKPDGSFYENFGQTSYYNPVSMQENAKERLQYKNLLGSFTAQLKLPLGFTYDVNLSYQNFQTLYGAYYNSYYTRNYNNVRSTPDPPGNPSFLVLDGANGLAFRNAYQNTNKILETFFTWDKKIKDHSINAVLGYSWQETINGDGFQASSTNFPVDDVGYNNLSLGFPYSLTGFRVNFGGDNYQQSRLISDFARVNYGFKDKYLLQVSVRRDGSSVFGQNERWGYFPAVSAGWRIAQEGFMDNQHLFTDLKLRASYGVTGNSLNIYPLTSKIIYGNIGAFYYNGGNISAINITQNENPDLRWEKTSTTNIGIDFSVLKGKLSGSIDVYNKKTTDIIWTYDVSTLQYPFGSYTANVGSMSNKGIEFSLNATPVTKTNFSWTSSFNLAHNANKLISLSNAQFKRDTVFYVQPDGGGQTGSRLMILVAGRPVGQFFTLDYAGKDANNLSQYRKKNGTLTTSPDITNDRIAAGSAQPKLLLGWANTFRYKNIDLNVFFRSVLGNKIFNVTLADLYRPSTAVTNNIPVEVASESAADQSYRYSTRFIESGSFLRLDNFTLGYNFKNISHHISNLRLYVSGNNVFIITGYKGIDPEINQGGLAPGIDANNFYPKTRTFMFGANLSF